MKKSPRTRLDQALVDRALAKSTKDAQALILAGEVLLDGVPAQKAGMQVSSAVQIELTTRQKYASRGGLKLEGALQDFSIVPANLVCLDVGASNGGFTDCLLQHGASHLYAVDVNVAQLAWKLQKDPRVTAIQLNARQLHTTHLPEPVDLVVLDVSFISVCKTLGPASACAKPGAIFLILIKPQFELPRQDVGAGGIVLDSRLHEKAIAKVQKCAESQGLSCIKVCPSRLTGARGNREYFLHARKGVLK